MIDRRSLIALLSASAAALMGHRVEAQGKHTNQSPDGVWTATGDIHLADPLPPPTFQLMLDDFGGFVVKRKGVDIKITPEEIWEALGGAK